MKKSRVGTFILLIFLSAVFLFPIFVVFLNSFKTKFSIMGSPFSFPTADTFAGLENYRTGIQSAGIIGSFGRSVFITVLSVAAIVFFTSMTAWYLERERSKVSRIISSLFIFSMIVPFQMVMYTMTYVVTKIHFNNPLGIIIAYLGFGSGLSVFMLSGFVKSIPYELEEAAEIDGCTPVQTFFRIVFPILKPTAITVAILNAMWIWNDYLLPYLILGSRYKTLPDSNAGRIRLGQLGRIYGNACACHYTNNSVLPFLPAVHHRGCYRRGGKGIKIQHQSRENML